MIEDRVRTKFGRDVLTAADHLGLTHERVEKARNAHGRTLDELNSAQKEEFAAAENLRALVDAIAPAPAVGIVDEPKAVT